MEWRNRKMREATEHLDRAYDCIREIREEGVRKGSDAGRMEFQDALDLLNLSERMAKRGSRELYHWEARNGRNA